MLLPHFRATSSFRMAHHSKVAATNLKKRLPHLLSTNVPASFGTLSNYATLSANRCRVPSSSVRNLSTSSFQEQGIMDENDLLRFTTLHELHRNASVAFAEKELFGTFNPDGKTYEWMTYGEFDEKVRRCRSVLKDLGVEEYSKVGIISNNRWEWAAITNAAYSLNATVVPMYEAQHPKDWLYILNDAGCNALFCATQDIYDRASAEVIPSVPTLRGTLCLDAAMGEPHAFSTAMEEASENENIIEPSVNDLANLIYTSGTTGKPKGVELIHSNFVSNVRSLRETTDDPSEFVHHTDRSLTFLPWAHSYGQTCELYNFMANGGSMGICRGVPLILEDLQLVKPTTLLSVPTLYKRVYDGVNILMESASPLRKKLMKTALQLGREKRLAEEKGSSLGFVDNAMFKVLNGIVLSKIRDRFGGNLRHGFSGGAAIPKAIIEFMDDVGIPIYEGYGLTETSPIIAINVPGRRKPGSIGKPLKGVEVVIMGEDGKPLPPGQEGEICCYGPNVMRGYYKKPEETEEVISVAPDGKSRLFHTGDLGRIDVDSGFVYITGRLKEQYKLENGKYVCPTPIEEAIGMSRFISQVVLCGANRPYNVALLVPDYNAVRAELKVSEDVSEDDLVNDERVKDLIDAEIQLNCSMLKKFEIPQEWSIVAPFTAANNMLTPKMSIRRHMVIKTYEDEIAAMYGDENVSGSADGSHPDEKVA